MVIAVPQPPGFESIRGFIREDLYTLFRLLEQTEGGYRASEVVAKVAADLVPEFRHRDDLLYEALYIIGMDMAREYAHERRKLHQAGMIYDPNGNVTSSKNLKAKVAARRLAWAKHLEHVGTRYVLLTEMTGQDLEAAKREHLAQREGHDRTIRMLDRLLAGYQAKGAPLDRRVIEVFTTEELTALYLEEPGEAAPALAVPDPAPPLPALSAPDPAPADEPLPPSFGSEEKEDQPENENSADA